MHCAVSTSNVVWRAFLMASHLGTSTDKSYKSIRARTCQQDACPRTCRHGKCWQLLRAFLLVVPTRRCGSGDLISTSDDHCDRPSDCWRNKPAARRDQHRLTYPGITYASPLCNNETQLTAFRPVGIEHNIIEHLSDPQNCTSCATCVQPSTRNCHHTDASSSQMWPWRIKPKLRKHFGWQIESQPSLVMHRQ